MKKKNCYSYLLEHCDVVVCFDIIKHKCVIHIDNGEFGISGLEVDADDMGLLFETELYEDGIDGHTLKPLV